MHLLEKFWSLDKNEKVISALQDWRGRAVLFVLCVLLFSVESADLLKALLLLGLAFSFAIFPGVRTWFYWYFPKAWGFTAS